MEISVQELRQKMDQEEHFILIDVREPYENEEFNIGGKLIPLATIPEVIPQLQEYKDEDIILYCRSGQRSGVAQKILQLSGLQKVWNLKGGVLAWQEEIM